MNESDLWGWGGLVWSQQGIESFVWLPKTKSIRLVTSVPCRLRPEALSSEWLQVALTSEGLRASSLAASRPNGEALRTVLAAVSTVSRFAFYSFAAFAVFGIAAVLGKR